MTSPQPRKTGHQKLGFSFQIMHMRTALRNITYSLHHRNPSFTPAAHNHFTLRTPRSPRNTCRNSGPREDLSGGSKIGWLIGVCSGDRSVVRTPGANYQLASLL
ncbi:hypothetical protein OCU04_008132 [Sclerotinia nivalis]|uniref:Uncharacterized protein n=1 Tax=Sclerotinia nivalis TaxID=352851 RepID=A0A9X0DHR4_9HELO|nr:hypothetical protein OCU04_008132 [Sclerotinia nivalis]